MAIVIEVPCQSFYYIGERIQCIIYVRVTNYADRIVITQVIVVNIEENINFMEEDFDNFVEENVGFVDEGQWIYHPTSDVVY